MRIYHSPTRKARLTGWAKWIIVIVIPFSVFFFETWLCTQSLQFGFDKNDLLKRHAELDERINALKADEAGLKRMDRIEAKAPDLGLVEPGPAQIRIVRLHPKKGPSMEMLPVDDSYDMARLGESIESTPLATHAADTAE